MSLNSEALKKAVAAVDASPLGRYIEQDVATAITAYLSALPAGDMETLVEPGLEYMRQAITDFWGERCETFEDDCPTCQVWAAFDRASAIQALIASLESSEAHRDTAVSMWADEHKARESSEARAKELEKALETARADALEEAKKLVSDYLAELGEANEQNRTVLRAAGLLTNETESPRPIDRNHARRPPGAYRRPSQCEGDG